MPKTQETVDYKRCRFSTRLPAGSRYTASHQWLAEESPGVWRVGFTEFATRMLGDLVDFGFDVREGDPVEIGQTIGWVEGFKAVTDLFCILKGEFAGTNPELEEDVALIDTEPYDRGWLYRVKGAPESASVGVEGYIGMLDATIDRMLEQQSGGQAD